MRILKGGLQFPVDSFQKPATINYYKYAIISLLNQIISSVIRSKSSVDSFWK